MWEICGNSNCLKMVQKKEFENVSKDTKIKQFVCKWSMWSR